MRAGLVGVFLCSVLSMHVALAGDGPSKASAPSDQQTNGYRQLGHYGQVPHGSLSAPSTGPTINGTGMARPGAGASVIGGPNANIEGVHLRARRL
jgi:hypothetical protein